MSDPTRLLDQSATRASTLELLRAIDVPVAPPPAVRAAVAQDLSGMVAGSAVKAASTALWLKASLALVAVVGAAGTLVLVRPHAMPSAPTVDMSRPRSIPIMPAPPLAAPSSDVAAPVVAPSAVPERAKAANPVAARDSLAEEEALLEAARQALAQNPSRALALLQKHRSQFPTGQLSAERMYLSVDCLQRLGNVAAAQREAAALTKYYPNSAYARRAPLLLASPKR